MIPVTVDRTLSAVAWSRSSFYPQDGDAIARTARLTFSLKRTAGVTVGIYSGATLVRTVWSNRAMAAGSWGWTWDGRNAAGAIVAAGGYVARITAVSSLGASVLTRAIILDAFSARLSATSVRSGQRLTVTMTTTEPLPRGTDRVLHPAGPGGRRANRDLAWLRALRVTFTVASSASGSRPPDPRPDTAGGLNV